MSIINPDWTWGATYDHLKARMDRLKFVPPSPTVGTKQHLIFLDVQHFQPGDINVSLKNGYVYVTGSHPQRKDNHGWVERSFSRKVKVPDDIAPDSIESHLSSDGILTIKAENRICKNYHRFHCDENPTGRSCTYLRDPSKIGRLLYLISSCITISHLRYHTGYHWFYWEQIYETDPLRECVQNPMNTSGTGGSYARSKDPRSHRQTRNRNLSESSKSERYVKTRPTRYPFLWKEDINQSDGFEDSSGRHIGRKSSNVQRVTTIELSTIML